MDITRRFFFLGTAAAGILAASEALAARRRRRSTRRPSRASRRRGKDAEAAKAPPAPKKPDGNPLRIPELVRLEDGQAYEMAAGPIEVELLKDKPVTLFGYNGLPVGPALKVRRGTVPTVTLVNRLDRPTNVSWHGLLLPGDAGRGPGVIQPGETRVTRLAVDQPAATLWYYADVAGRLAEDLIGGLSGLLIVDDDSPAAAALPSEWGVDDIPILIQDRTFDDTGRPVYQLTADVAELGFRGTRILANGTLDAVASVPRRLVRLRLVNGSNARVYRFFFSDERPFRLVATDGGFLPTPVDADTVSLAPGERVEILVDFADGGTNLMSTPDDREVRSGSRSARVEDLLSAPFRVCAFFTESDGKSSPKVPATLATLPAAVAPEGVRRRRFVLQTGGAPAAVAGPAQGERSLPVMLINGKSFDASRVDEQVPYGATEIWDVVCPEMAHPFHVEGVQFRVLTEEGGIPRIWNRGVKDTVLVENSASLLVTFTRRADASNPFVYRCQIMEHADSGMMGTFTVG